MATAIGIGIGVPFQKVPDSGVSAPVAVSHSGDALTTGHPSRTISFTPSASTSMLLIPVQWALLSNSLARTLSSVTVDGVAATINAQGNNSSTGPNANVGAAICSIAIAPGATARSVVVTLSGSVNRISASFIELNETLVVDQTASDLATDGNVAVDVGLSTTASAIIVSSASGATATSGPNATWNAEATEIGESSGTATNHSLESSAYEVATQAVSRTVSVTSNNTMAAWALVAASFKK